MNFSKKAISYSLIASFYAGLGLLAATNAIAGQEAYPSDKGCNDYHCPLIYTNNSTYDIKREEPSESAAGASPEALPAGKTIQYNIDSTLSFPNDTFTTETDMENYCSGWGIQYRMRFRFYEQGYDKGYCDISFKQECGYDRKPESPYYWFTGFRTDSPQADCTHSNFADVHYTKSEEFKADTGEYYKKFIFTFSNKPTQ